MHTLHTYTILSYNYTILYQSHHTINSTTGYILHYPKTWDPIRSKYRSFKESNSLWARSLDVSFLKGKSALLFERWKSGYDSNAVETTVQRNSASMPMTMIVTMTMMITLRRWTRSRRKIMMTHNEDEEDDDQHCNDPIGDAVSWCSCIPQRLCLWGSWLCGTPNQKSLFPSYSHFHSNGANVIRQGRMWSPRSSSQHSLSIWSVKATSRDC